MSASELDSRNIAISMRKSVENLVISSQDAIGQSISQALNFSGVMSPHTNQTAPDNKSVSRSPSPSLRNSEGASEPSDSNKSSDVSGSPPPLPPPGAGGDSASESAARTDNLKVSTPNPARSADGLPRSKKKSWYNSLYPTYKSKSEDFKRLFKDLPEEERLIVDYSCALQKDILAHGRLYASQSYLCFYASIFGWETSMCLRWKDVTAITKEKTALVIPNAILVCTETEKNFLASFSGRDKAYLMLFRIWQNALMDQPMSSHQVWHWVHSCYGEELGFNSDDEGYPRDYIDDAALAALPEDLVEVPPMEGGGALMKDDHRSSSQGRDSTPPPVSNGVGSSRDDEAGDTLPTDMSDSSDSEQDKPLSNAKIEKCSIHHEWRLFLKQTFPINVDQLFTMMFTNSKFNLEILALRNISDYVQSQWQPKGDFKTRQISYTAGLTSGPIGPKEVQVTETQSMHPSSHPGVQYSIDSCGENAGIPYADHFSVNIHYCLSRAHDHSTQLAIYGIITYKKSLWSLMKNFIEKNTYAGVEEFVRILVDRLNADSQAAPPRSNRRLRSGHAKSQEPASVCASVTPVLSPRVSLPRGGLTRGAGGASRAGGSSLTVLALIAVIALLALNAVLYYKMYSTERQVFDIDELQNRLSALGGAPGAWARLLERHSRQQRGQLAAWRAALDASRTHLAQTEQALTKLLELIKPALEKSSETDEHIEL